MEQIDNMDNNYPTDDNEYAINQVDTNLIDNDFDRIDPYGEVMEDSFGVNDTPYLL